MLYAAAADPVTEDSEYIGTQTSGQFFGGFTPAYTARPAGPVPVPAYRPGQGEMDYQPNQPYRPQENIPPVAPDAAAEEVDEDDAVQTTAYRQAETEQPKPENTEDRNAGETTGAHS